MEEKHWNDEPAIGIPYNPQYPPPVAQPYNAAYHAPPPQQQYYVGENPYQAGVIPPNAVYGDPKGIPIQQTIYRDTPAPFNCVHCGDSGLTSVKSTPSLAACIGCMMPMFLGICFLCPQMDCLWHKHHYCPHCNQKVADFEKSDPCAVVDPVTWTQQSYALPA